MQGRPATKTGHTKTEIYSNITVISETAERLRTEYYYGIMLNSTNVNNHFTIFALSGF